MLNIVLVTSQADIQSITSIDAINISHHLLIYPLYTVFP